MKKHLALLVAIGLLSWPAKAQVANNAQDAAPPSAEDGKVIPNPTSLTTIANLTKIADALTTGTTALGGLADGLGTLIEKTEKTWSKVAAKRLSSRLNKIYAQANRLSAAQNNNITNIDVYVHQWDIYNRDDGLNKEETKMLSKAWSVLRKDIKTALGAVVELDERMRDEHSPWVRDDSYSNITAGMAARRNLLKNGGFDVAPPLSPLEVAALREVQRRYRELHVSLEPAIIEMNSYLKKRDAPKT